LGLAGGVREPADGDEYVGLVADDVDHLRGELVKLKATVNCHVPSARQGSVLVAVADLVLGEFVRSATGSRR
jgi:hypothetical protein